MIVAGQRSYFLYYRQPRLGRAATGTLSAQKESLQADFTLFL